jgi:hypothetical protein
MEEMQQALMPAQFGMFQLLERDQTQMVALYDIAPRFVFMVDQREGSEGNRKMIEREFSFAGSRYRITLTPARIKNEQGVIEDEYLSERDQVVEEVIRRLATTPGRLALFPGNKVRFSFTNYEVRQELKRLNHTFSHAEVNKSIMRLNKANMSIEFLDAPGSPTVSAAAFPVAAVRRGIGAETMSFVEFHPLVADAIRLLRFQSVHYETLMRISDPVSRWLYKRLHIQIAVNGGAIQSISATDIRRDCGLLEWKKSRNQFSRLTSSVEKLMKVGMIDHLEAIPVLDGRKIIDVNYTMAASAEFMGSVHASNRIAKENVDLFNRLVGCPPGEDFVPIKQSDAFRLRALRSLPAN